MSTRTQPDYLPFLAEGNVTLTPEQASAVLDHAYHPHQRRISPDHVANLRDLMVSGQWNPKDQLSFARIAGQRLMLLNGHHRMTAQSQSGETILWNIVIHDVPTEAEAFALYARFDTYVRGRTGAQIAAGAQLDVEFGLPAYRAAALIKAMPPLAGGLAFQRKDPKLRRLNKHTNKKIELAREWLSEAGIYHRWTSGDNSRVVNALWTAPVLATALATIRADVDMAEKFWREIYLDDGLRKSDPRKALVNWLSAAARRKREKNCVRFFAVARAWNAWCRGEDLTIIRPSPGAPVKLTGTPFTIRSETR